MANTPKVLHRGTLSPTPRTATVPTGKRWIITNLVLANTTTAPHSATVALDGVTLVPGVILDPGAILTLDCTQVLDAGKSIRLTASGGSAVAAHVCGVESDL